MNTVSGIRIYNDYEFLPTVKYMVRKAEKNIFTGPLSYSVSSDTSLRSINVCGL